MSQPQQAAPGCGPTLSPRRLATRDRLLKAATAVFLERGVVAATVEEICEAAGFTRGAFYSNFADKGALLEAIIARESAAVLELLEGLTEDVKNTTDIERVLESFFEVQPIARDHYLIHTELALAAARDPEGYATFRALQIGQWERMGQTVVASLRRAGLEPTIDVEDLVQVLYGVLERSVASALVQGRADTDAMARRVLPIVLSGLTRPITPA